MVLLNFSWFFRCGIIPVDRTQYPSSRFNSILKNRYDTWVAEGKNDIPAEELDAIFNGASDDKSATNTAESIPVSNSKSILQLILLNKLLIMIIKINFFKLLS